MTSKPNTCVHCGYERKPHDLAPPWQCPRCKKAYEGHRQVVQRAGASERSDAAPGLEVEHPYSRPAGWVLNGLLVFLLLFGMLTGRKKGKAIPLSSIDRSMYQEPVQKGVKKPVFSFRYRGSKYLVKPVADYELWGLVVTHNDISSMFDSYHDKNSVDTKDLCVIWGHNLRSDDFKRMKFWSSSFVCHARFSNRVVFYGKQLSNNHLITDKPALRKLISKVRVGDQIRIKGMLVNYANARWPKHWRRSSVRRTDTGMGACEVSFVNDMEIVRRGTPIWYALDFMTTLLFWMALIARIALLLFGLSQRVR